MVIDTSAVLAVLLNEPTRPALIRATQGKNLVAAPSLPWEVGNALIAGLRRRRLTRASVNAAWSSYRQVQVRIAEIDVGSAPSKSPRTCTYTPMTLMFWKRREPKG